MLSTVDTPATYAALLATRLAIIARANPRLHALATVCAFSARAQVSALDRRRLAGEHLGPLAGMVVSVKDQFATAHIRTTGNMRRFAAHTPRRNHALVQRLMDADAVVIGKSTLEDGGRSSLFPLARHPLDVRRLPGGSSSGAAVAVASRMSDVDLATDTGGSILVPAHLCGVWGFRPTQGLLRIVGPGLVSHEPRLLRHVCGSAGVLACDFAHLRRAAAVLLSPTAEDALAAHSLPSRLRLYWVSTLPGMRTQHAIQDGIAAWAARAASSRRGGAVVNRSPLDSTTLRSWFALYQELWELATTPAHLRARGGRWQQAWQALDRWRIHAQQHWNRILPPDAVFACPVAMTTAPLRPDPPDAPLVVHVDGVRVAEADLVRPAELAALLGVPAVSMPIGQDECGLPYGVLLLGHANRDSALLRVAAALETRYV